MAHTTYEGFPTFGAHGGATRSIPAIPAYPPKPEPSAREKSLGVRDILEQINCLSVFDVIRRGLSVTQAEIIEATRLSSGAVSQFVTQLVEVGLVQKVPDARLSREESTTAGRKRVHWEVSSETGYVIAIDVGQTHLRVVVTDMLARIKTRPDRVVSANEASEKDWNLRYTRDFRLSNGPDSAFKAISYHVRSHLNRLEIPLDAAHIVAIAVGVPGHVDTLKRVVNIPLPRNGWSGVNVAEGLARALEITETDAIPIYVENNANLGAIGVTHNPELRASASNREDAEKPTGAEPPPNTIYVKVGTNIEAGLFLNGALYRGSQGTAGEIGHVQVQLLEDRDGSGKRCSCGREHCLDLVAGSEAVIAASGIDRGAGLPRDQIERVVEHALNDTTDRSISTRSKDAIERAGRAVGLVLVNLIKTLNPADIVLDGAIVHSDGLFLGAAKRAAYKGLDAAQEGTRPRNAPPIRALPRNAHAINSGGIYLAIESSWQPYVVMRVYPQDESPK